MSDQPEANKRPQFELRDNGEIHLNKKGSSQLLAKYDDRTGILTFESFAVDQKHRLNICEAVIADPVSGELKGHAIKAFRIAGRPFDTKRVGEPPPPKKSKTLGDKTPEYVRWLFRWRPQAAYARYGVFLDSNGEPERAHCHRLEQGLVQPPTGKPMKIFGDGKDALQTNYLEDENGILALRQTCMTFLRNEVVGADGDEGSDDDDEPLAEAEPGAEEAAPLKTTKPRRAAAKPANEDEE